MNCSQLHFLPILTSLPSYDEKLIDAVLVCSSPPYVSSMMPDRSGYLSIIFRVLHFREVFGNSDTFEKE